ncbi:hypothetical protein JCM10207_003603 [Rhodosporidiobolus poonsookiae]
MPSYATLIHRLLASLNQLPTSPAQSVAPLQRLTVRTHRALDDAHTAQPRDRADRLIRLKGRLQELDEALDDLAHQVGLTEQQLSWAQLRQQAHDALEAVTLALREPTDTPSTHSRTPSADLPRRLPPPSASSSTSTPLANLDTFLSRALQRPFPPPSSSSKAAARAQALSEAYTLFRLATAPESVLPAGETLSSLFRSTHSTPADADGTGQETLEKRISSQLHRAYFDSLASALSSPSSSPADVLAAWTRLASDLSDAALPLVPSRLRQPGHPALSARDHLAGALRALPVGEGGAFEVRHALRKVEQTVELLQRLCAPARDSEAGALFSSVRAALAFSAPSPAEVVELVRRALDLANGMAADMARFRAGLIERRASEGELRQALREKGGARERAAVREVVGERGVRRETRKWVREKLGRAGEAQRDEEEVKKEDVASALVETLFSDDAVALPPSLFSPTPSASSAADPPPTPPPNTLPPILLVPSPTLFELQNRLQALVILACLLTLAGPLPAPSSSSPDEEGPDLPARLWTLLDSEVPSSSSLFSSSPDEPDPSTAPKLANLADELLSHRRRLAPVEKEDEARLRAAVDRILRAEDPVYRLLKGRLKGSVKEAVVAATSSSASSLSPSATPPSASSATASQLPAPAMRTGRAPSSSAASPVPPLRTAAPDPITIAVPQGFSTPPLLKAQVERVVRDEVVGGVWAWVEETWGGELRWRAEDGEGE